MISNRSPAASRTCSTRATSLAPVVVVEAELDALTPAARRATARRARSSGSDGLAARGVREDAIRATAEQAPERLVERTPDEVPHGHLGRPRAAAVEVDGLAELPHDLRPEGIDTDQVALERPRVRQVPSPLA